MRDPTKSRKSARIFADAENASLTSKITFSLIESFANCLKVSGRFATIRSGIP